MPMVAQWDINDDCNLNCKHCRVLNKNTQEKELTLEQAKSLLSQLYYCGTSKLNLSGGEPFLRKDLFEILDYTTKFDDIVITTNCTLINDKIAQKLAQYPNVRLSISIDGMEEIHDKFRGRKGTFQKIINTLPILKENGVKFSIRYTLTKDTIKDAKEVLKLASKNGAEEFNTRRVILTGNASENLMISNEEYKIIIKELIQECKRLNIKFRTGDPLLIPIFPEVFGIDLKEASQYYAGCEAGDEIIYIDFKGNVGACSYIPMFADNIKEKSLDEILEKNKLFVTLKKYKESLKGKCQECTYKMICGGCRATALALKKSLLEEDPLCLL
mgnify:FL=1